MNGRIALVMVLLMVCPVGESLCASHSKSRSSVSTGSKARSSASPSSKSKSQTSSREKTSSKSSSGEKSSAKSGDSRGKSRAQKSGSSREDSSEKRSSRKSAKSDDSKNSRSSRKSSEREKDEKDKEERSQASRSERSKKDDDSDAKKKTKTASSSRTSREKERAVASKGKEKSSDKDSKDRDSKDRDSKEKDSEEHSPTRRDPAEKKAVTEAADEEKRSKPAKDTAETKPEETPSVPASAEKKAVVSAPNTIPTSPAPSAPPTPPATTAQATPAQDYHVLPGIRPGAQLATLASLGAPAASTPRPMPVYTPAPLARTPSATAASWATYKEKQSGGILISNALALPMRKYQPPVASLPSSPASGVIANVNCSPISSFNSDYKTRSANAAIPGQLRGKGWDGKDVPIGIENLYRKILPKDYMPTDLTLMAKEHSFSGQPTYLRREAAESLTQMFNDASRQGLRLQVLSGYRDFGHQMRLYLNAIRRKGSDQHSVAKPGSSEHMLGTTADVTNGEEHLLKRSFANTPEGRWLEANAHRYGWKATVRSSGGSHVDEPWHLRYVGQDAASADHPEDRQSRLSAMGHTIAKPFTSIKKALTRR